MSVHSNLVKGPSTTRPIIWTTVVELSASPPTDEFGQGVLRFEVLNMLHLSFFSTMDKTIRLLSHITREL